MTRLSERWLLWGGIALAIPLNCCAACAPGGEQAATGEKEKTVTTDRQATRRASPLIDAATPAEVHTATFALG